jgi:hypothetical protein
MNLTISTRRVVTALILAGCASLSSVAAASASTGNSVQSITPWMQNAAPVGWSASLNRVIYNVKGTDGMFDAYSANPDGSNPQCLTCTFPSFANVGTATNRGASDVSPDGRYMLVSVERGDHSGIGANWTQPGKGGANDVWLYSTDGAHAWPLTNIYASGQMALGTIWARFDRTGNEIVWASMYSPALLNLGYWQLKVANVVWTGGVPGLANVRVIEPAVNSFFEPYGFSPDDSHILFASNAGTPSVMNTQIDTVATDGTGLTQLTTYNPTTAATYNEFAFYTPSNTIVYGSTLDANSAGMDYWVMNANGTSPQRLTYFNSPWHTEALGYSVVGGLAFNPSNPNQFIAGVSADPGAQTNRAYMVNLNATPSPAGLTTQLYSDPSYGQLAATTQANPSDGFDADGAPAPGVPATNYSVKWTGSVTPPTSGSYSFCVYGNNQSQLWVAGQKVANSPFSLWKRVCMTVSGTAGVALPIELDYTHGTGPAYAQLSWIPPGASTPTVIPTSALSPTGLSARTMMH